MSFPLKSSSVSRDVPVQFLPWLRPGAAYDKENILKWPNETDFGEPNTYKYREKKLDSMAQCFDVTPKIADIAKFIKVDPELFAHFLLTSPPAVRQFFDFDRETVLLYVYYVHETLEMVHRKPGCVNDFKSGYSYLVALDSRNVKKTHSYFHGYYYDAERIRVVLEQNNINHPMLQNCKVLLNWAPATIEQLRECVYKSQCGNLFFTLDNLEKLKTEFIELLKRVTDIENNTILFDSDLVKKSWALTTTLISRYPLNSHNELLNCFLNKFTRLETIQKQVCDILKKRYQDNIKKIGAEKLYNQILSWRPEESAESNSHWTKYVVQNVLPAEVYYHQNTKHDQPTNSTGCQESLSKSPKKHQNKPPEQKPELPLIRKKNDLATTKIFNQPAPKTVNSDVDDRCPVLPPILQPPQPKLPVPKTMIRIPSGSSAFWQKVFDGYDVVIKQDEKSTARVTTETGQKFTVQVIQPRQFNGISNLNEKDAQFELNGNRFVCQFCTTFLSVHSKKEGIVYCRCGEFKQPDFLPGHATCSLIFPLLSKDRDLSHIKVINRPVPKTVIRIPYHRFWFGGHLSFWQKVFDDNEFIVKKHHASNIKMTTTEGEKFDIELVQPYRFYGISKNNGISKNTDKKFKKNNVLFVCQFCATLLKIHCENDDILYCRCGMFESSKFISADHNFDSRHPEIPSDEMNILLIGASGAGKSTLINSIANLVKFSSLKDASKTTVKSVIPSRINVYDDGDTMETVVVGQKLPDAENEHFNDVGESITQQPRTWSIETTFMDGQTRKLNFIDTPGVNDVRGVPQDDISIKQIKRAMHKAGYLHAICFVLLPTQSVRDSAFESLLRQLMEIVPKEGRPNIVYFFTNTRSTGYRPGPTLRLLQKFAADKPHLEMQLSHRRLFCYDNEFYNFLGAYQNGKKYCFASELECEKSWEKSMHTFDRFLDFMDGVKTFSTPEIGFLDESGILLKKSAKALKKLPNTNMQYDTAIHLIGVLASSFNGKIQKAREIAQAIGITEDVKLLPCQQLAFFRQLTRIEEFLNDNLSESIKSFCDVYEPSFALNI